MIYQSQGAGSEVGSLQNCSRSSGSGRMQNIITIHENHRIDTFCDLFERPLPNPRRSVVRLRSHPNRLHMSADRGLNSARFDPVQAYPQLKVPIGLGLH
jgi:hypothetical protein